MRTMSRSACGGRSRVPPQEEAPGVESGPLPCATRSARTMASDPKPRLIEIINDLHNVQAAKLLQFAEALAVPIDRWINRTSDIVTESFADEFEARLKLHHATHSKQLD